MIIMNEDELNRTGYPTNVNEPLKISNSDNLQDKIVLKTLEAHHVVCIKDIVYCKSEGNYTTFHLLEEKIMISKSLKQIESLLSKEIFMRCHQSYMVNMSYVKKYTNEGLLVLKNSIEIPVASRRKEMVLKKLFQLF